MLHTEAAGEPFRGAVAQLGERCVRNAEVEGSTPFRSTREHGFEMTLRIPCRKRHACTRIVRLFRSDSCFGNMPNEASCFSSGLLGCLLRRRRT
jgi:hypothetical protein